MTDKKEENAKNDDVKKIPVDDKTKHSLEEVLDKKEWTRHPGGG